MTGKTGFTVLDTAGNHIDSFPFLNTVTSTSFGYCGGMCFGALDYFMHQKQTMQTSIPSQLNDISQVINNSDYETLEDHLNARQMDSVRDPILRRLTSEMLLASLGTDISAMSLQEFTNVKNDFNEGSPRPPVLVLIRRRWMWEIFENHQVVAIRYNEYTGSDIQGYTGIVKLTRIFVYDPNHANERFIDILEETSGSIKVMEQPSRNLYGFFVNTNYDYNNPPVPPDFVSPAVPTGVQIEVPS